jgi:hypothetical protein
MLSRKSLSPGISINSVTTLLQRLDPYDCAAPTPTFVRILCAREIRGDFSFGEQLLDIADNTSTDWSYNPESGKVTIQKEAILRSKIRIEARQFHMARLHPQQWGRTPADRCQKRLGAFERGRAPP